MSNQEILLSIAVFSPVNPFTRLAEFKFLGSQPLTALRDAFYCLSDFFDLSEDAVNPNTLSKKISSSYLFIENTFYNDMRWPLAEDYSKYVFHINFVYDRLYTPDRLSNGFDWLVGLDKLVSEISRALPWNTLGSLISPCD